MPSVHAEMNPERGINRNIEFQLAVAEFQEAGGEFGVAYAILCAAYGRLNERERGNYPNVDSGKVTHSPLSTERGRDNLIPPKGKGYPSRSALKREEGKYRTSDKDNGGFSSSRHLPGTSKRGAKSMATIQDAMAQSIFRTFKLPDGRSLDKVRWHELPKLASEYRSSSRVLMMLYRKVTPPDQTWTVDQCVTEADVTEAIKISESVNDIL